MITKFRPSVEALRSEFFAAMCDQAPLLPHSVCLVLAIQDDALPHVPGEFETIQRAAHASLLFAEVSGTVPPESAEKQPALFCLHAKSCLPTP